MRSVATSAQLSSSSSLRRPLDACSTKSKFFIPRLLARRTLSQCPECLGYLLTLLWNISPASAAEDDSPISQPNPLWPFNLGPQVLGDFTLAIATIIIIFALWISKRQWPHWYQGTSLGVILLGFSTFASFCIISDSTTSHADLIR